MRKTGSLTQEMEQEPVCQSADSISGELSKIAALLRTDSAPGPLSAAAEQLDALRKLQPTEISVLRMLADVYFKLHRYEDAEKQLSQILDLSPDSSEARWMLAWTFVQRGSWEKTLPQLDVLLKTNPDNSDYLNLKARSLLEIGEYNQAIACHEVLIAKHPTHDNWIYYGRALKALNRIADCIAAYREAIALKPESGEAYWSLANLKTFRFQFEDINTMSEMLARTDLDTRARAAMHFALGKALEDARQYASSFEQYQKGNAAWRKSINHDADNVTAFVRRCKTVFTPEFFRERSGAGSSAPDPIFIVSLPRSGSTLVEQILASHSTVEGTRELAVLHSLAEQVVKGAPFDRYPGNLRDIKGEELRGAGEEYIARTRVHRKLNRPFFIDKMTGNFLHLGLLHLILPNAKIIDIRRHPLGCGFANFKQFYHEGSAFAFDLTEIGRFYRDYVELMAHFDAVLPGRVHRVFYEHLVANPEQEIRSLLAYCGLPFEEACMRFYETERGVFTISAAQVRQPIYTDALEQWRSYERWLEPLKAALGDVLTSYPAVPEFGELFPASATQWRVSSQVGAASSSWTGSPRAQTAKTAHNPLIKGETGGAAIGSPIMRPSDARSASRPLAEAKRKLFPPLQNPILAQAAGALANNRADLAEPLVSSILKEHPADPNALNLMADIARRSGQLEQAERLLSLCLEHAPDSSGYRFNYVVILRGLDKVEKALAQLDVLLNRDPKNALFREQKAKLLHELGRHADALICRQELADAYPASPEIWLNYADSLRMAGRPDQCVTACRKALELAPRLGGIYPRLANLKGYRFTAHDIEWLEKRLAFSSVSADDRASLHFVLGNAYGEQKLYAKSFENYAKANGLRRLGAGSDPERLTAYRLMCDTLYTEAFFRERMEFGCSADAPIFIVGLPRSGSTLLEQILSAHTAIDGLGEIPDLLATVDRLFQGVDAEDPLSAYARAVRNLTDADSRSLGETYMELTRRRRKLGRPFFTDKALTNFVNTGLIQLILPKAKIIDVRRHPLDCGWSCFKSHFPGGQPFSHDLSDIGRQYTDYLRLMAHFDRVLPGRIHRVIYEDLVANPETEVRRLFDYLGLPFEEQCLRFHENKRLVRTLSGDQVRVPLYKSGVGQWRPYEQWLGPLKTALGDVLTYYPAAPRSDGRPPIGGAQWRMSTEIKLSPLAWAGAESQAPANESWDGI
jgi:tetratricopeptide (TPR) repeat protein